jgi:hypothetical protein
MCLPRPTNRHRTDRGGAYKEQEIVSDIDILTKFEGTATVTGTYQGQQVTGTAFLELVGDWS